MLLHPRWYALRSRTSFLPVTLCGAQTARHGSSFGLLSNYNPKYNLEQVENDAVKNTVAQEGQNEPHNTSTSPAVESTSNAGEKRGIPSPEELESLRRRRRTEWKRRQGQETFLDNTVIHIRGGRGGDGCVAFHREKFMPYGPPSGGAGGRGGDVYILPSPHLTTLSSVRNRIRGNPGGHGQGKWKGGKEAEPTLIRVPLGTIVRELAHEDPRRAKDELEAWAESVEGLELEERKKKERERRWVHYPSWEEDNVERRAFKEAERAVVREERHRRIERRVRRSTPIELDLSKIEESQEAEDPNAPLGVRRAQNQGHLVARGGVGGYGNPHFLASDNRAPKFATRGADGERISLSLELKLLADVGLVGVPNAGKSTVLRALTGGRAKTRVEGYAFTTLNPVVAVVRVKDDGTFEGEEAGGERIYDETRLEEEKEREAVGNGEYAESLTRNQKKSAFDPEWDGEEQALESFRFTVADNPGLIEHASDNVGLGHSFLRSIERSPALAYVVDLSGPAPAEELHVLREELEKYKPGMSKKARMIIANKADLLGGEGDEAEIREAKEKLTQLEGWVKEKMGDLDVVPISAKYGLNMRKVVGLMKSYVEEARKEAEESARAEEEAIYSQYFEDISHNS